MKHWLTAVLGVVCIGLAVFLFVSKRDSDAQHDKDVEAFTSVSNLLSSSQMEVEAFKGQMTTLSNGLQSCQSTSLTFSNELAEAKSDRAVLTTAKEDLDRQVTDLKGQITRQGAELETAKQAARASSQRITDMTYRIGELTNQLALVQGSLAQANKDYVLLENRFRRDVAERVITERKFNNRTELKSQLEYLQWNPSQEISENRIREGLNVVVGRSNLCYVIAPEGYREPWPAVAAH